MKTLLVPVTLHDALPSVFATAVLVARRFGSLIEGVALRPALAEYVPVDMVGGMTWLRDEEADQAEAQDAGQRFVAAMEAAGERWSVAVQWHPETRVEVGLMAGLVEAARAHAVRVGG